MSGRVRRRKVWSEEWRKCSEKQDRSSSSNRRDHNGQNQHQERNRWRLDQSSTRDRRDGGRLGDERQRREKSEDERRCGKSGDTRDLKKEDYRMRGKKENSRLRCNYEENRGIRENSGHAVGLQTCMDMKGRESSEDTRRRNFEYEKQDRNIWNRGKRDLSVSVKSKDRSEINVIPRHEVELGTKDCDKKKDKFDPSDFQRLVLSKGANRAKHRDLNRNVVLVEKVMKGIEVKLDNKIDPGNYKDYSYNEYSGLLSKSNDNTSNSEDDQKCGNYMKKLKQDSASDQDHSIQKGKRNLNLKAPGKHEVSTAIKRHRTPEISSSTEDDAENVHGDISDNSVDEDIDDEYMISVMKDVVTENFERKRSALRKFRSRYLKPRSPDSDLSSNFHPIFNSCQGEVPMKTLNERFGKTKTEIYSDERKPRDKVRKQVHCSGNLTNTFDANYFNLNGEETAQLSIARLPSPRPASASAYIDSLFTKCEPEVCETKVFQGCSPSSPWPEAEQFQSLSQSETELQNRSQHNVVTEDDIDECEDVTSAVGVKQMKFEDEIDEDMNYQVDPVCVRKDKNVVILDADAENYSPDLGKEVKYEEPSPEVFEHVDLRADVIRFTPITQRMHNVIVNAMLSVSEVVLSRHNIDITKHDLYTLTGTNWLNDQVVEIYLAMISQRSLSLKYVSSQHPKIHSMSTYFFTNLFTRGYSAVKKWTKEVDIFTCDMVLVPIHMDSHWSLASIDFRVPGVFYYDSLGSTVNNNAILTALLYYLGKEHMDKRGKEMNLSNYAKQTMDCPLQQNGSDCGVFCCKVGDYLSRDLQLEFCQEDVKYFRKRTIFEILRGVLLEP